MIAPPLTREQASRMLRVAARSADPELAEMAHAGLRMLRKAPAMPRGHNGPAKAKTPLPRPTAPSRSV